MPVGASVEALLCVTRKWWCLPICVDEHFSLAIFDQLEWVWYQYDSYYSKAGRLVHQVDLGTWRAED